MKKNVAEDIAEKLVQSVKSSLIGRCVDRFSTVKGIVKDTLVASLTSLLTPKRSVDLPQLITFAQQQHQQHQQSTHRTYSICFVGVNGVGKSTSLSKVAAYLLSCGFSVGIAACDTFRSGAVEQLKTHCLALGGVPLFARGYDKDAATVAADAMVWAQRERIDVLLIDTAGRMQDNEPLMRALSKLITLNNPDLVCSL